MDIKDQIIQKQDELIKHLKSYWPHASLEVQAQWIIKKDQLESELSELKSRLKDKEPEDFPEIDFRKDIAEELSRDELINRLYEMNESYQAMRKEWFEKVEMNKDKEDTQDGAEEIKQEIIKKYKKRYNISIVHINPLTFSELNMLEFCIDYFTDFARQSRRSELINYIIKRDFSLVDKTPDVLLIAEKAVDEFLSKG